VIPEIHVRSRSNERHVAARAVRLLLREARPGRRTAAGLMAANAFTAIVGRFIAADALVRIVAGQTGEFAARQEAAASRQVWGLMTNAPW